MSAFVQTHSPSTRARAVLIFRQCVMTLFTVKDEHPEAVKAAIGEILPQWLDAFRQLLEIDVVQELSSGESWEGLAVRTAIFNVRPFASNRPATDVTRADLVSSFAQALEVTINSFPSTLKASLPHFLALSASHLTAIAPIYHAAYLSSSSDFSVPTLVEEDSQVPSDLPGLVATILDFVTQAARRKAVKGLFVQGDKSTELLDAAFDSVLAFAQMTTDDVCCFRAGQGFRATAELSSFTKPGGELGK
jgi:hypothetical protein